MTTSRAPPIPINACDGSYDFANRETPKLPNPIPMPPTTANPVKTRAKMGISGATAGDGGINNASFAVRNRYGFKKLTNPANKHTINNVVNTAQLFSITSHETKAINKITDNMITGR